MAEPVSIQVGGNVSGSIVVGDNNLVVNTNHGTIIYKQAGPQVKKREFAPQPPRAARGFVNRSVELQNLETWISTNEIVMLYGPDGMGKSALIKQAANTSVGKSMPGGVIPLEPVDADGQLLGPDDIIQKLFDALFESDPHLKVDATTARTYLSNTKPLILLDEVPLPQPLQRALPELFPQGAILMAADVAGSGDFQRILVGPLPRNESIGLLANRAGVDINDQNRATFDAICNLLSDVSLAIVITANVLRETSVQPALALEYFSANATNLTPGVKSTFSKSLAMQVQPALDRAFAFAFNQLKPEEQKILSTAALTPGLSMTVEWLSSALGNVDATVFIERLKSLGLLFTNSPRLRIPPGIRQPAQRSARSLISETDVYQKLIEFIINGLSDPAFVADELGNLLATVGWAVRHAEWNTAIRLGRTVDSYLTLNGLWDAWETNLGIIREAAMATGDKAVEGWVLHQLGTRLLAIGNDNPGAEALLRAALQIRQNIGDRTGAAFTQHNLNLLFPMPISAVKPSPRLPHLWIGVLAAGIIVTAIIVIIGALYFFGLPSPTPIPIPSETPFETTTPAATEIPITTTISPSLTAALTLTPSLTPTNTPTFTPTPPGGSGQIVFQMSQSSFLRISVYNIYKMDLNNQDLQPVLENSILAIQPAWSPDGKSLAFASRINQSGTSQIYTVNADGSNLQQVTPEDGNNYFPTWSPDGKRIAYAHYYNDSNTSSDIFIINIDGSTFDNGNTYINLTNSDGTGMYQYLDWSPDGERIAYQNFWRNNWEIFVINADGSSKPVQLTNAKNQENDWSAQPGWSPDNKRIVFASNRSGAWDIYTMNPKGGNVKALTQDDFNDVMPDWSPDGHLIAFSSNRDGIAQIYLINVDGSGIKQITSVKNPVSEVDWRPNQLP